MPLTDEETKVVSQALWSVQSRLQERINKADLMQECNTNDEIGDGLELLIAKLTAEINAVEALIEKFTITTLAGGA